MAKKPYVNPFDTVNAYQKCLVYWCRFCNGSSCMLKTGDSMKEIVCIRDEADAFFAAKKKGKSE